MQKYIANPNKQMIFSTQLEFFNVKKRLQI